MKDVTSVALNCRNDGWLVTYIEDMELHEEVYSHTYLKADLVELLEEKYGVEVKHEVEDIG